MLAARLFQPFVGCEDWKVTSLWLGGYFRPVHLQLRRQKADVFAVIEDAAFAHYNSAAWIWRTLSAPFEVPCLSARWWFFSNLAGKDLPSTYEPCIGWCSNSICNCDFWAWFQLRSHRGCRWTSAYEFCAADCGSTGLLSRFVELRCVSCVLHAPSKTDLQKSERKGKGLNVGYLCWLNVGLMLVIVYLCWFDVGLMLAHSEILFAVVLSQFRNELLSGPIIVQYCQLLVTVGCD